jgi:hypothetical protein
MNLGNFLGILLGGCGLSFVFGRCRCKSLRLLEAATMPQLIGLDRLSQLHLPRSVVFLPRYNSQYYSHSEPSSLHLPDQ